MLNSEVPSAPELEAALRIVKRGCDELLVEAELARQQKITVRATSN